MDQDSAVMRVVVDATLMEKAQMKVRASASSTQRFSMTAKGCAHLAALVNSMHRQKVRSQLFNDVELAVARTFRFYV